VVRVTPDGVYVLSDEEKWVKAKRLLAELQELLEAGPNVMPHKRLEQIRGVLIYVTLTYPCMVPYLIGIHMTIDSWRGNRDADGWRLSTQDLRMRAQAINEMEEDEQHESDGEVT
jgi:hypothetical protein